MLIGHQFVIKIRMNLKKWGDTFNLNFQRIPISCKNGLERLNVMEEMIKQKILMEQ
jgi:hypothetical protein